MLFIIGQSLGVKFGFFSWLHNYFIFFSYYSDKLLIKSLLIPWRVLNGCVFMYLKVVKWIGWE